MADQKYPVLVTQNSHGPGMAEEQSFEDTLRDLVRASPYLFVSIMIHAVVGAIFYFMPASENTIAEDQVIKASAEEFDEPIPPEEPEEEEIEEIEEIIEEPVVTEDVVTEVTEVIDNLNVDANFDSTGLNDAIGIGGGGGGGFGKLGRRGSKGKVAGKASEQAVDAALKWLSFHQTDLGDGVGYWSGSAFDLECGRLDPEDNTICDGLAGTAQHDVGLTGLALLAFLGAGNTDKEGKYKDTVKKGLKYLMEQQETDGCLAPKTVQDYTYSHIIATLALTEAYALTGSGRTLKKAATNALDYMYSIRNPGGAWRYADFHPEMLTHENDVSVTGWAVLAMTLAKEYKKLPFQDEALTDAMLYIEEMTDEIGRTGYIERGGPPARLEGKEDTWPNEYSESMTAVGILCRIFADPEFKNPENHAKIEQGVKLILANPLVWDEEELGRIDFYYWYYATYALYQFSADPAGRSAWKSWESSMVDAILKNQVKGGEQAGSWAPQVDPWGSAGGRVYSTAILALCMEVFYRYDTVIGSK